MTRPPLPAFAILLVTLAGVVPVAQTTEPPNEPADVQVQGSRVTVRYDGRVILEGRLANPEALRLSAPSVARAGGTVDQVVAFYAKRGGAPLQLAATITASGEAFPA